MRRGNFNVFRKCQDGTSRKESYKNGNDSISTIHVLLLEATDAVQRANEQSRVALISVLVVPGTCCSKSRGKLDFKFGRLVVPGTRLSPPESVPWRLLRSRRQHCCSRFIFAFKLNFAMENGGTTNDLGARIQTEEICIGERIELCHAKITPFDMRFLCIHCSHSAAASLPQICQPMQVPCTSPPYL